MTTEEQKEALHDLVFSGYMRQNPQVQEAKIWDLFAAPAYRFDSIDHQISEPEAVVWFHLGTEFLRRRFPATLIPDLLERGVINGVVLRWKSGVPQSVKDNSRAYSILRPGELEKVLSPYLQSDE